MDTQQQAPQDGVDRGTFDTVVSRSLVALFKPLARLCFNLGLTHRTVTNAVRRAFVEVAHDEKSIGGKTPTYSRVSLLTGIDRKQVVEILAAPRVQVKANPAVDIIEAWAAAGGYPLAVKGKDENTFQTLVRKHCADLSYTTLLEHLVDLGAVQKHVDGKVRLINRSVRPNAHLMRRIQSGTRSAAGAAAAVVEAVSNSGGAELEQPIVSYALNVPAHQRAMFQRDLGVAAARCKQVLADTLVRYEDRADGTDDRVSVALFHFPEN